MDHKAPNEKEARNWYSAPEWWLVLITLALVVVTLGLAIFTAKLLKATVKLGGDAKESGERQASMFLEQLGLMQASIDAMAKPAHIEIGKFILTSGLPFGNNHQVTGEMQIINWGDKDAEILESH